MGSEPKGWGLSQGVGPETKGWSLRQSRQGRQDKEAGGGNTRSPRLHKPFVLFYVFVVVLANLEAVSCKEAILEFCARLEAFRCQ